jgi:hypothetical protein
VLRCDEGLNVRGGFIKGTDEEEVPEAVQGIRHAVMCAHYIWKQRGFAYT